MTVVVVLGVSIAAVVRFDGGEGEAGAGFVYRGAFYHLSSAEVKESYLGRVLDRDVPFQDNTVSVRRIRGVAVGTAVAAYTKTFPGTGSARDSGWLLLSPRASAAADPWAKRQLARVVLPPAPR
jgi:hypothetical protein